MTRKGYMSLQVFIEKFGIESIKFVVSARDINVEEDCYEDIKKLCDKYNVLFYDRGEQYIIDVKSICVAISWRWLINYLGSKLIVFHDSLLPKYRGFAPLVTSLINGEKEIGVTALLASDEYDKGPIIMQKSCSIVYPIKISNAVEVVANLYCELILELGDVFILNGDLSTTFQNEHLATYSLWLDEEDYAIKWNQHSSEIVRFIDAVGYPYKGASSLLDGKKVRIVSVREVPDVAIENRVPGKVIFIKNGYPSVVCGQGILEIIELIDETTKTSILPLKKFRSRFK
jgi:methionyl-tRNA formyltransferase